MSTSIQGGVFGSKQEAVITPQVGYELDKVIVINTANNQIVPSSIIKVSDEPVQYKCCFEQPAGQVSIKPVLKPILYSIIIEENEFCNIVLVEQNSRADVAIRSSIAMDEDNTDNPGFNNPQRSFNEDADSALDVEEQDEIRDSTVGAEHESSSDNEQQAFADVSDEKNTEVVASDESGVVPDVGEEISKVEEDSKDFEPSVQSYTEADTCEPAERVSSYEEKEENNAEDEDDDVGVNDVQYDAGKFADELEEKEPIYMSQEEFNKKGRLFWQWQDKYTRGECTEEKWKSIYDKHMQLHSDIDNGLIVVGNRPEKD